MPTFEKVATILNRKGNEVLSVSPDSTVHDALAVMAKNRVAAVLILSDGELAGIVSAKDYGTRVILEGKSSRDVKVKEIMSKPVITVGADVNVFDCLKIMTERRIRHLPVVDQGKIAGVVSMGDLSRSIIADQGFAIDQLKKYIGHS
jgi:CBS domain-containing protein